MTEGPNVSSRAFVINGKTITDEVVELKVKFLGYSRISFQRFATLRPGRAPFSKAKETFFGPASPFLVNR